jgi:hypothetical protein
VNPSCKTCNSPLRAEIERAYLLKRVAAKDLEAKFGMTRRAIYDHCKHHLSPEERTALRAQAQAVMVAKIDGDIAADLSSLIQDCKDILQVAKKAEPSVAIRAIAQIKALTGDLNKYTGRLQEIQANKLVAAHPEVRKIRVALTKLFNDEPAMLAKLDEALKGSAASETNLEALSIG